MAMQFDRRPRCRFCGGPIWKPERRRYCDDACMYRSRENRRNARRPTPRSHRMVTIEAARRDNERRARTLLTDDARTLALDIDMRQVLDFFLSDPDRRDALRVILDGR
jgi:hypothetical protein